MSNKLSDELKEALFYKRKEYFKNKQEIPLLMITLSNFGLMELRACKDYYTLFSNCCREKMILGFSYTVRPSQKEPFKIIER